MNAPKTLSALVAAAALALPACQLHAKHEDHEHHEHNKLVATSPKVQDVVVTQQYVCQIRSQRNIEVCALQSGYLEPIAVTEGQAVKQGDVLFRVIPTLYQARLDAEVAEAQLAQLEYDNTKRLHDTKVVSYQEVALAQARLDKARAKVKLAQAELDFTVTRAPFDGIVDRLVKQQGSEVKEGEVLTNLSDNSTMWVYFNVPEARYFEYKARQGAASTVSRLELLDSRVELILADGKKFDHDAGNAVTVEAKFNNETGNIAFRADVPNPDRLLRHGQTGTILIHRTIRDAVVIPQRATFEILDKRYVYVLGEDHHVHQRPITIAHELEDTFVIQSGVGPKDKILLEGVRQVHENETVEAEYRKPDEALSHQKFHAE
jgi:membrane fusion protein (multidrug efflux system)